MVTIAERDTGSDEDIMPIAEHFLAQFSIRDHKTLHGFDAAAERAMCRYNYPGNVRELENIIERAVTLARGENITLKELPAELDSATAAFARAAKPSGEFDTAAIREKVLEQQERRLVEIAVKRNAGNLDRAAMELGIGRTTLWRKMKRYGIEKNDI